MTSKKKGKHRFFRRKKNYRRHKDRRIPIIATTGAVASFFVPRDPGTGNMSAGQWVLNTLMNEHPNLMDRDTSSKNGFVDFAGDLLMQYVGYDFRTKTFGIPMASVVLVGSSLASKVVNKFAGNTLSKIPYVGKYIKF